ncbi:MAG: hypothetical protein KME30_30905 [Iphinoe sp. HA4291-MV1]|nr:hypothetical protein [Iphinoe sp. HA4291-MV1]
MVNFRQAMIEFGVDQRLIERTVEIAKERGGFGSSNRVAVIHNLHVIARLSVPAFSQLVS